MKKVRLARRDGAFYNADRLEMIIDYTVPCPEVVDPRAPMVDPGELLLHAILGIYG